MEEFASHSGLVAYIRMGVKDSNTGLCNALVEFEKQTDIPTAFGLYGHTLNDNLIK